VRVASAILGRDAPSTRVPRRPPMSDEFNWWLLIVGVVAGAALTWLVVADSSRREREVGERELPAEASWIARSLGQPPVDADTAERVLRAHRRYLGFPPPDVLVAPEELAAIPPDRTTTDPEPLSGDPAPAAHDLAPTGDSEPAAGEPPAPTA
jgi:hypothetical protein